ncbi:Methyltransferase FkbM [Gracilaria domingensis]|nr:Methyltransferase FkbM [Gracilaria domingensis]
MMRRGDAYGGWTMCTPLYSLKGKMVYTIGIGRNIKWDEAMIKQFGTVHHGWDPTPTAQDFFSKRSMPHNFVFHRVGLAAYDGELKLKLPEGNADSYTVMEQKGVAQEGRVGVYPVLKLQSMMRENGHGHLAVLKIDVEGAEFDVIKEWRQNNVDIAADQVLIEFHARYFDEGKSMLRSAVADMDELGFLLVHRTKLVSRLIVLFESFPALDIA